MRRRSSRPSPAMVVAIIALVVALGGTATAAGVIIKRSSQVARGAINSGDLADDQGVNLVDLTPAARLALTPRAGPPGPEGARGPQGPPGARGEQGVAGPRGTALAYAYVRADGTLDARRSKGVETTSFRAGSQIYCFDLAQAADNAVASIDFGSLAERGISFWQHVYPVLPITETGVSILVTQCPVVQRDAAAVIVDASPAGNTREAFWISFN